MHELIGDITLCILFAWVLGLAAHYWRQPSILAYLVAGFAIGPFGTGWVKSQESISVISELGLIFMLFMIGLEIDLKKIIRAGPVILIAGGVQLLGGAALGILFFVAIGMRMGAESYDALYLCVACALSSTVIIVKVLYEKRELDTLPGRITLGVLVLQDVFAILFLAVQPSLDDLHFGVILLSFARAGALVAIALLLSRYVPPVFHRIARTPELILLGALAWCFLIGEIAERLHLSREMGSLIAGVSLSTFPYALDVTAKVTTLRDFFITLFFVALGMTIPIPTMSVVGLALVIALFTVASRLLTTFTPLYMMRQGLRASLLPALNLAQISEFSLVVIQTGAAAGHLKTGTSSAASFAFVLLAVLSTFVIVRSDPIVRRGIPLLKRLGLRDLDATKDGEAGHDGGHGATRPIVLLGFFRTASALLSEIERNQPELLERIGVVDFNPVVFRTLSDRGIQVTYGDISNVDTLVHAGVGQAELIILSIPDSLLKGANNEKLVRHVRSINATAKIVATADLLADVNDLYNAGADYVTVPRLSDAQVLLNLIQDASAGLLSDRRQEVEALLADRREVLP